MNNPGTPFLKISVGWSPSDTSFVGGTWFHFGSLGCQSTGEYAKEGFHFDTSACFAGSQGADSRAMPRRVSAHTAMAGHRRRREPCGRPQGLGRGTAQGEGASICIFIYPHLRDFVLNSPHLGPRRKRNGDGGCGSCATSLPRLPRVSAARSPFMRRHCKCFEY